MSELPRSRRTFRLSAVLAACLLAIGVGAAMGLTAAPKRTRSATKSTTVTTVPVPASTTTTVWSRRAFRLSAALAACVLVIGVGTVMGVTTATAAPKGTQSATKSTTLTTVPVPASTTTTVAPVKLPPAKKKGSTGPSTTSTTQATVTTGTTNTTVVKGATTTTTTVPKPTTTTTSPTSKPAPADIAATPTTTVPPKAAPTGVGAAAKAGVGSSGSNSTSDPAACGSSPMGPITNGQTITSTGTVTLTKPVFLKNCSDVTFTGGTWDDPNTSPGKAYGGGVGNGRPAFNIIGGTNITLEDLNVVGVNRGGFKWSLAFNGGIETQGTAGLTLSDVKVAHVFGDCLTLNPLRSDTGRNGIVAPVRDLTVNGFSGTACGRQGITLASVNGATLTNVVIGTTGFDAFDAEADQSGREGAENVTVNQCTFSSLIAITSGGGFTGPITFSNCAMDRTGGGDVLMVDNTSGKPDAGPITFSDDTLRCGASVYVSCFQLDGATDMVVQNSTVTIGFPADEIHESTYSADHDTHITFANDVVNGFGVIGNIHAGSTATVTGGSWTGHSCRWPAVCPKH